MRKVVNTANQAVITVIDGETYRFNARETKILEATIVDHPDFQKYPTLVVVGTYVPPVPEQPIVQNPQEESHPIVVDEPKVETAVEADDTPQEEEIKEVIKVDIVPKKKRKSTKK